MAERRPLLPFVCVENPCRSQMAEGFARAPGRSRVPAYSAGPRPSGEVDPRAAAMMREMGIEPTIQLSKGLDDLPAGVPWDRVVTMGCGDACPHLPARHRRDRDLPDPKPVGDDGFRAVRDRIERLVAELLREACGPGEWSAGEEHP